MKHARQIVHPPNYWETRCNVCEAKFDRWSSVKAHKVEVHGVIYRSNADALTAISDTTQEHEIFRGNRHGGLK